MVCTFGRSVSAAAVVLLVVVTGCNDVQNPQSPKLEAWGAPPPQTGELRGVGFIGSGTDVQTFGFDVKSMSARITGLFLGAEPSTSATLITGPTEPGTFFTAFRSSSSFCSNASHGAEFDGVGHLVEPTVNVYVVYTIKGCDNGPAGFGVDTWSVDIPSRSYHKDGAVTGDIQKQ
jgi:hypothetical protein